MYAHDKYIFALSLIYLDAKTCMLGDILICFDYCTNTSVSCFTTHLGARIIVGYQSWVDLSPTDKTYCSSSICKWYIAWYSPADAAIIQCFKSCFTFPDLYSMFPVASCPVMSCHSCDLEVEFGLLHIFHLLINDTQFRMSLTITKVHSTDIVNSSIALIWSWWKPFNPWW